MKDFYKHIGRRLKILRQGEGLTLEKMSNFLECDLTTISYYENAKRKINLEMFIRYKKIFGFEYDKFFNFMRR
jgi:transcriptional regulator with XRE-family HTH domain